MKFNIQVLYQALYEHYQATVITELKMLDKNDLRYERELHLQDIPFQFLFRMQLQYNMPEAAHVMIDQFFNYISPTDITESLGLLLRFGQFDLFTFAFLQYQHLLSARHFSILFATALCTHRTELFDLIRAKNKNRPMLFAAPVYKGIIINHPEIAEFLFHPGLILSNYTSFTEAALITLLKKQKKLLWEFRKYPVYEAIAPDNTNKIGTLIHFALYHKQNDLFQFLLERGFNVHLPFFNSPNIYLSPMKWPGYLLVRTLPAWQQLMKQCDPETATVIKKQYCKTTLSGELMEDVLFFYQRCLEREPLYVLFWELRKPYRKKYKHALAIIDSLLQENNADLNQIIAKTIDTSIYDSAVFHIAVTKQLDSLLNVLVKKSRLCVAENMLALANYPKLEFFEQFVLFGITNAESEGEIFYTLRSLLTANLLKPLYKLIDLGHLVLFKNPKFIDYINSYKSPEALLYCLEKGLKVNASEYFVHALYGSLLGDTKSVLHLLEQTKMRQIYSVMSFFRRTLLVSNVTNHFHQLSDPRFNEMYGSGVSQAEFKTIQGRYAMLMLYNLKKGRFRFQKDSKNFVTISHLAEMRAQLAMLASTKDMEYFGEIRKNDLPTYMDEFYRPYFKKFYYRYYKPGHPNVIKNGMKAEDLEVAPTAEIIIQLDNKPVKLTSYIIHKKKNLISWLHTPIDSFPAVEKEIQSRLETFLERYDYSMSEPRVQQAIKEIGIIHWLLAHMAYCNRGSAFITEVICSGLFMFIGQRAEFNKSIDCEALGSACPNDFANEYPGFFAITPMEKDHHRGFHEIRQYLS